MREFEKEARERLPQMVYDYYAGGAGDEITLRENELAWGRRRLRPRVLVDVSACDARTTVFGEPLSMPLMTAPCALNSLAHPDGELAVARATAAAGILQVVSSLSSHRMEEISAVSEGAGGRLWFQLYCYRDRGITRELVQRAEAARYAAVCVTVDVPRPGTRERDTRNRFQVPPEIRVANLAHQVPSSDQGSALLKYVGEQLDPGLTWDSIDWLRGLTRLPVVLKGILTAEDAALALAHGAAGIVVSNHGGRQLDTAVATCDALPEIAAAAQGTAEVFVDGGIRRGTDVLKAVALGARAALIGRPYLWGLAVEGETGVRRVIELLREELLLSMALSGCASVGDIKASLVAREAR